MITVRNSLGQDPLDYYIETSGARVGRRIRKIRIERGMTQAELGAAVGLDANRIQKYENGFRKPKAELLKKIAGTLGVSTLALVDSDTTTLLGAMFAFFELEEVFNMKVEEGPEDTAPSICLSIGFREELYGYMREWLDYYKKINARLDVAASNEEREEIIKEYHNWKWSYPQGVYEEQEAARTKSRLKKRIEELQEVYDNLP